MNGMDYIKKLLQRVISPIFLIFLALSFVLWYISSLSHSYTSTIDVDVVLDVTYDASVVSQTPSVKVELLAQGNGTDLLLYKLGMGRVINVPLSDLILMKEAQDYIYSIDEGSMLKAISQKQNQFSALMITDTIAKVKISPTIETMLPIVPRFEIDCAPQYTLVDNVTIWPDSIRVKAPKSMLDTIKSIYTQALVFENVRENLSGVVALDVPSGAYAENDIVRYGATIMGYYQESVTLNVTANKDQNMLIIPSKATLIYRMPRESKALDKNAISITVDEKSESLDGQVHRLRVSGLPKETIAYSIKPQFVEMYIVR